jgi:hypothetical protein
MGSIPSTAKTTKLKNIYSELHPTPAHLSKA